MIGSWRGRMTWSSASTSLRIGTSHAENQFAGRRGHRPLWPRWRARQPADTRHEGLELDRRGTRLGSQARAFGAVHFHCDDLYDAGWKTSVSVACLRTFLAAFTRCMSVAAKATAPRREKIISPSLSGRRVSRASAGAARVGFLAPTCSYIWPTQTTRSTSRRAGSKSL